MNFKSVCSVFVLLLFVFSASSFAITVNKPTKEPETCVTSQCHGNYAKKNKFLHEPVSEGECDICHESADPKKHTYTLAEKGNELCESCHMEQTEGKNIHKPLKEGDCMQCHDPHGANNKLLLVKDSMTELCGDCHKDISKAKHLHGPVAVGQCSVCHNAHSSDHDYLLRVEPEKVCFSCHTTTEKELKKFEFVHGAVEGECTACHNPHGADNWKMLNDKIPDLCYSCHDDIQEVAEGSTHKHGAIEGKESCLSCHTPHASSVKYLLKKAPTKLCQDCHDKPLGDEKKGIIPAFTEQIKGKKFTHGPVMDNGCPNCHKAHGSNNFRMLDKQYPAEFYASFKKENYELCFNCHPESRVLVPKTREVTDFRNGDINLHYLHVNKERRGRTCRACHQTHASNQPKHIRESVPYGTWDLPIGFEKTETGGSCAPGCHAKKDYDRDKPVTYVSKAKAGEKGTAKIAVSD